MTTRILWHHLVRSTPTRNLDFREVRNTYLGSFFPLISENGIFQW